MQLHPRAQDTDHAKRSSLVDDATNGVEAEFFGCCTWRLAAMPLQFWLLAGALVFLSLASPRVSARTIGLRSQNSGSDGQRLYRGLREEPQEQAQPEHAASVPQTQQVSPSPQPATISGTVLDMNGDPVAGASVVLQGLAPTDKRTAITNANGFYEIASVTPRVPFHITVSAAGFASWTSPAIVLAPGQYMIVSGSTLHVQEVRTTVTVSPKTAEQIAIQQVKIEEIQRGFGFIPNFYEAFDPNPEPLTAKLKFKLALRDLTDPVTIVGTGVLTAAGEATGIPRFEDGAEGLGQRMAANYTNQATDIMLGDAVLPSLFHQDPRYFYQGTGSTKSRLLHAISAVFVAKGDNGRWQPNYSGMGGDLASAAIANLYYPPSNRGVGLIFQNFGINTGIHMASRVMEEFLFHPPH